MLTPEDIDNKKFKATRLKEGYDQDEVDDFLDQVASDFADVCARWKRLEEENASLRRRNESLTNAPTAMLPPTPSTDGILRLAQETADRHVAEAQAKADEIIREAGAKGARIVEEADEAADGIKLAARKSANEIIAAAQAEANEVVARKNQISEQINTLATRRASYKQWLKDTYAQMEQEDSRG